MKLAAHIVAVAASLSLFGCVADMSSVPGQQDADPIGAARLESTHTFNVTPFAPADGVLLVMNETSVTFTLSTPYVVNVRIDLWAENGSWGAPPQEVAHDGGSDRVVTFQIPQTDLHYKVTVSGEHGVSNEVYVRIES